MTIRTTTRIAAAGLLAVAAVLPTSAAQALSVKHPEPQAEIRPVRADLRATVLQLLDESRQAATVSERRLTHHELVQSVLDGE